jgi:hypothetical protein
MKIDKDILNKYVEADKSFLVNQGHPEGLDSDQDLTPIRISLPHPPKLELIDGYGLPSEEQYWRRLKIPETLIQLEEKIIRELQGRSARNSNLRVNGQKIIDAIWEEITENKDHYKFEIEFIKKQWYYRIYGYWFYNNGKPTYICGWHYMYLTWWYNVNYVGHYAEYRERDRKNFLFWYYTYTTKETFKNIDPITNLAIPNEKGNYEMIEMSFRTCYGPVQPKNRRGGTTNMTLCAIYCETTDRLGKHGAILSQNSESAYKLFSGILVRAWEKMPFFFKPTWDGYYNQETVIKFSRPKNIVVGEELKSKLDFAQSARGSEYDGDTVDFADIDEPGKTFECDTTERWSMFKQTLSIGEGASIRGWVVHPSTVEDMVAMGGIKYQSMIKDSNFYQRNPISGQTKSGLFVLYFPAYENLEEFTDKYGMPIMENPTEQQIKDGFKRKHGSRVYLQSNRDMYLKGGTPQDMKEYRRLVAKFPFKLEECFKMSSGDVGFDIEKIDKRLAQLRRMKDPFVIGNFIEINGKVRFEEDKENGKFRVSKLINHGETDLKKKHYKFDIDLVTGAMFEKEEWMPLYPGKFTAGGDPFKYNGSKAMLETTGSYMSDGGFSVFWERDKVIDPGENMFDWESYRFVCTYRHRPATSKEFCKDCLLACRYYGAMLFPEINVEALWEYFEEHGYGGYLLYEYDEVAKKLKNKPGVYNLTDSKNDIFDLTRNYIEYRSHKECHSDLLEEWKKLRSFDDLNKCDLAAAAGCCFLGSKSRHKEILEGMEGKEVDFSWWDSLANA